jgi:glycine cleavage system transcriptional repressor
MSHLAVAAVGEDRPGIIAALTAAFVELGCNLEDTSMTVLRGTFAMTLVVSAPAGVEAKDLEAKLAEPGARFDLLIAVRPVPDTVPPASPGSHLSVSVYGADRPGIVQGVTAVLAARGVNVVDLTTRVIGDTDRPVYAMVLEVVVPPDADADAIAGELENAAAGLGVECTVTPADADIL